MKEKDSTIERKLHAQLRKAESEIHELSTTEDEPEVVEVRTKNLCKCRMIFISNKLVYFRRYVSGDDHIWCPWIEKTFPTSKVTIFGVYID